MGAPSDIALLILDCWVLALRSYSVAAMRADGGWLRNVPSPRQLEDRRLLSDSTLAGASD